MDQFRDHKDPLKRDARIPFKGVFHRGFRFSYFAALPIAVKLNYLVLERFI
jgi:hypothetical protein